MLDYEIENNALQEEKLIMRFDLMGALGNYIVYLKLYDEIIKLEPHCAIDIIVKNTIYGEAIFGRRKNIIFIFDKDSQNILKQKYDVILQIDHRIALKEMILYRVNRISPLLCAKFIDIMNTSDNYMLSEVPDQYEYPILIRRALIRGENRYTALGHDGIFNISDAKVPIDINEKFCVAFSKLL